MSEIMLIGGSNAGKTTFTAALRHYLLDYCDKNHSFDFRYGDAPEYEDAISDFENDYQYPDFRTESGFLVTGGIEMRGENERFDLMDLPGEEMASDVDSLNKLEKNKVIEDYGSIRSSLKTGERLSTTQWETLFKYRYIRSDSIIYLINLQKIFNGEREMGNAMNSGGHSGAAGGTVFDWNLIKELSEKPIKNAIILTGCDKINYDPSKFEPTQKLIDPVPTFTDSDLADKVLSKLNKPSKIETRSYDVSKIIKESKERTNMDIFGVSIPEEANGEQNNRILSRDGSPVINGFGNVIKWIKR